MDEYLNVQQQGYPQQPQMQQQMPTGAPQPGMQQQAQPEQPQKKTVSIPTPVAVIVGAVVLAAIVYFVFFF